MAFCPNCGTPNTEQAEKCAACGFELVVPKQKAKFKGTIMMSGIKAPNEPGSADSSAPAPSPSLPPPPTSASVPPRAPTPAEGGRNLSYQKTIMGPAGGFVPQTPPRTATPPLGQPAAPYQGLGSQADKSAQPPRASYEPSLPAGAPPPAAGNSYGGPSRSGASATTFGSDVNGLGATDSAAPSAGASGHAAGASSFSGAAHSPSAPGSYGGPPRDSYGASPGRTATQAGAGYESTLPPAADKPKPGKVLALGCAAVAALLLVVSALLYYVVGPKLKAMFSGGEDEGSEAVAWQASMSQSLTQVMGLCQVDCSQAGVFFHPLRQAALLDEARAITPARLQKLGDPTLAEASMLDGTDDEEVASKLGLDPQQCARITAQGAKVISCSVPDPSGRPSVLRIVELKGISSL